MDMKNPSSDPHKSSKNGQIHNGSISTRPGSSKTAYSPTRTKPRIAKAIPLLTVFRRLLRVELRFSGANSHTKVQGEFIVKGQGPPLFYP